MMRSLRLASFLCAALTLAAALAHAAGPPDEERAAWRYRRAVTLPRAADGPGFAALPLPPEVLGKAQDELRDLRLVRSTDTGSAEVPYVMDRQTGRTLLARESGELRDTRRESERTVYLFDLGAARTFDTIEFTIPDRDFVRRALLEAASATDGPFQVLARDAGLFDQAFSPGRGSIDSVKRSGTPFIDSARVHHTVIELPRAQTARYLRLTLQEGPGAAVHWPRWRYRIPLTGVTVQRRRLLPEERFRRDIALRLIESPAPHHGASKGPSRYALELPPGLSAATPLEVLELSAADPAFHRRVTLWEEPTQSGGARRQLGTGMVYRLPQSDLGENGPVPAVDERALLLTERPRGGALVLEVDDEDSPPLRDLAAVGSGVAVRLLLPVIGLPDGAQVFCYYGNGRARAPRYDLGELATRPPRQLSAGELGNESDNPSYRATPPLATVPTLGAGLPLERWRLVRDLTIPAEGVYRAELQPQDLGALRRDLGDLRIVVKGEGEPRQVPYVLSPPEQPRQIALTIAREQAPAKKTRYRLSTAAPLPLWGLELRVPERFFQRAARVLVDGTAGGPPREVFAGTLRRGAADDEPDREAPPLRLPLAGEPFAALVLEIDEGDNAPLTLQAVAGEVLVPRLAFKAAAGAYQVLFGNGEAEAPRYDLSALRSEVLAFDAEPLVPGALVQNPSFRRRVGDLVQGDGAGGGGTLLLWGAIALAVVVLLGLTAKLARDPGTPPKPE